MAENQHMVADDGAFSIPPDVDHNRERRTTILLNADVEAALREVDQEEDRKNVSRTVNWLLATHPLLREKVAGRRRAAA